MSSALERAQMFRFDQMAYEVKDKVEPADAEVDKYIGLEHIDPESLKIRRWGEPSDVASSKMLFRSGDIIFGKRRAYQRKLAVADFDGICSAHAMVLRPKTDIVLEDFLPFFMQSDIFMDRAVKISVGGLSPTINWRDLAKEKFALPPLEEQRRIAEALLSAEQMSEALFGVMSAGKRLFESTLNSFMSSGLDSSELEQTGDLQHPADWGAIPLADVASVDRGKFSHRPRNLPEFYGGPYPFAQTGDVAAGNGYDFRTTQSLSDEGVQYSRSFPPNTILITIAAVIGATAITSTETWCTDSVVGIVPNDVSDAQFIEYAMRYRRSYLEYEVATQTAQKNINLAVLRPLLIPWPRASVRQEVVAKLNLIEKAVVQAIEQRQKLRGVSNTFLGTMMQTANDI